NAEKARFDAKFISPAPLFQLPAKSVEFRQHVAAPGFVARIPDGQRPPAFQERLHIFFLRTVGRRAAQQIYVERNGKKTATVPAKGMPGVDVSAVDEHGFSFPDRKAFLADLEQRLSLQHQEKFRF